MYHTDNHVKRQIFVTFQREGVHCYPEAATDPDLADVSFLGFPHRHIFHFRVTIDVTHNNRDLEFIQVKRKLEGLYTDKTLELNHKSCEMIAEDLYEQMLELYDLDARAVTIEVSEDGENGAVLSWPAAAGMKVRDVDYDS